MFKLKSILLLAGLLVFLGGALQVNAQEGPIAGGYADTEVDDEGVVAAANFAIKKHGQKTSTKISKIKIVNAKVQVVAGLNYELCMEVSVKKSGRRTIRQFVQVVVYRNLQNTHALTRWTILKDADGC